MPAIADRHVRPEALPRAPLLGAAVEDLRAVDPQIEGSLNGHDDLRDRPAW